MAFEPLGPLPGTMVAGGGPATCWSAKGVPAPVKSCVVASSSRRSRNSTSAARRYDRRRAIASGPLETKLPNARSPVTWNRRMKSIMMIMLESWPGRNPQLTAFQDTAVYLSYQIFGQCKRQSRPQARNVAVGGDSNAMLARKRRGEEDR